MQCINGKNTETSQRYNSNILCRICSNNNEHLYIKIDFYWETIKVKLFNIFNQYIYCGNVNFTTLPLGYFLLQRKKKNRKKFSFINHTSCSYQ